MTSLIYGLLTVTSYNQAWEKRVEVEIDAGLKIPFIGADSLIAAKLASGRPEDGPTLRRYAGRHAV
jgi:hypothetical protein